MKKMKNLLSMLMFVCAAAATAGSPEDATEDFQEVIRRSKSRVFPAVVYIRAVMDNPESGKESANIISGSGVIIDASGEVLTNYHVIDRVVDIRCQLEDGSAWPAKIIGGDSELDVALIRLLRDADDTAPLPVAELDAETGHNEGDFVMAMGAPWGMNRSVSLGIVSCASRYLPGKSNYSLWYQTDASISPGNSGGPLVNISGRVIGINTLGSSGGTIGFTVPAETILDVLPRIREYGKVNWSWFGFRFQPLHDFDRNIYFPWDSGVIISSTEPGSPAREAGFLPNDRLIAVDGEPVTVATSEFLPGFRRKLALMPFDRPVNFQVVRGDETITIAVAPQPKGSATGEALVCPRWGMSAQGINRFDTPNLYFYRESGVFIMAVVPKGNAARAGLVAGDIIVSVNGQPVNTLEELSGMYDHAVELVSFRPRADFIILRNGQTLRKIMDFSNDLDTDFSNDSDEE